MKKTKISAKLIHFLLLCVVTFIFVFPFGPLLTTAFDSEIHSGSELTFWPKYLTLSNFSYIFNKHLFLQTSLNSFIISSVGILLQIIVTVLAAYPLARKNFRFKRAVLLLFLSTMMITENVTSIPLYLIMARLNILDTHSAIILPIAAWAFSIFIFSTWMKSVPVELEESAKMEGAGDLYILIFILLPLSMPALATIVYFGFNMIWNQYLLVLIAAIKKENYTLVVYLRNMSEDDLVKNSEVMAGTIIAFIPSLVVFSTLRKYFKEGINAGSIKG